MDTNKYTLKQANSAAREARKERDYYKGLSGMYQLTYDDDTAVHSALIILQGIYVELQSDLLQYKQKNGNSDRVEKSQTRINLLREQIDFLSKLQTSNISLKAHLKRLEQKNYMQYCQINDLQQQLILHTENL